MKDTVLIGVVAGFVAAFIIISRSRKRTIFYEMGAGAADAVLTAAGDKISDLTDQASDAWHGEWGDEWDWMENQPGW